MLIGFRRLVKRGARRSAMHCKWHIALATDGPDFDLLGELATKGEAMLVSLDQVAKARMRGAGLDLEQLVVHTRDKAPCELDDAPHLAKRHEFLRRSIGDEPVALAKFERIIQGNEIQDVNFLTRGARAAKAVARISIREPSGRLVGFGTGFLIAPEVLITNNHVLPDARSAERSEATFCYELDVEGQPVEALNFSLDPQRLFVTSADLDFSVVAVRALSGHANAKLSQFGFLPLVGTTGKVVEGEWLTIVQHPRGERKQLCVRENKLVKRDPDVLWYSTDTLAGSSGSPVFNNDWYVVALHHSGVPEQVGDRIQTIHGQTFDPSRDDELDIKWIANEGIRVSRIVETLRTLAGTHPMLEAVSSATADHSAQSQFPSSSIETPLSKEIPMDTPAPSTNRVVVVTLGIDARGSVSVLRTANRGAEAVSTLERASKATTAPVGIDVPFNAQYDDRSGYDPRFLDGEAHPVHLPRLNPALLADAAELLVPDPRDNANRFVLKYHNFSVVMHKRRRFAMYSAANVDFAGRFEMGRPPDVWRTDPRISAKAQIGDFYYARNEFDRGHLTRREDLEFGMSRRDALISAADTCHWTNCTPQHAQFNRNRELWQGIERHILEGAIERDSFRAQVFTGPILDEGDPVWEKFDQIQYPVRFWKVVVAINASAKLFGTAYILDQSDTIAQFGIETAAEVPFEPYKTYQVRISEVERLTGLSFRFGADSSPEALSKVDPMESDHAQRAITARRNRVSSREGFSIESPTGYLPLTCVEGIIMGD